MLGIFADDLQKLVEEFEGALGQVHDERDAGLGDPDAHVRPGEALHGSAADAHHVLALQLLDQLGLLDVGLRVLADLLVVVLAPAVDLALVRHGQSVARAQAQGNDALS